MNGGWVKVYRSLLEHPRFPDPDWLAVWVYLLLNATHQPHPMNFDGRIVELQPGQLITGRHAIADATGVHPSKVKRILATMKTDHQLDQQAGVKGSLFTVRNWQAYQESDQQIDQQVTSDRPASDQPVTTNKKGKKGSTEEQEKIPESLARDPVFLSAWKEFQEHRRQLHKRLTPLAAQKQLAMLATIGPERAVAAINHSIAQGWQSIHEPKGNHHANTNRVTNSNPGKYDSIGQTI